MDALGGRVREFLALLARLLLVRGRRGGDGRFVLGGAVARVHVVLDGLVVLLDVLDDFVLHRPAEEVELADGGLDSAVLVVRDGDALPSAERVEAALRVGLELELVVEVDLEARSLVDVVDGVVLLGVVGGEPVDDAQRDVRLAVDDAEHLHQFGFVGVVVDEVVE